jgi:hypothetical protein
MSGVAPIDADCRVPADFFFFFFSGTAATCSQSEPDASHKRVCFA